jgi:Flp pilus assembly protein TadG
MMNDESEHKVKPNYQKGQAIVEIAVITPLLLIALYIPADFGIAFFVGNLTQNAAREGARIGSTLQKNSDLTFGSIQVDKIKTEVFNRLPDLLNNKTVTVKFYSGTGCMEFVEVTAQGQYSYFLYHLMGLFGATVPDSVTISRTTQIRYVYQQYTNTEYCSGVATYGPYTS